MKKTVEILGKNHIDPIKVAALPVKCTTPSSLKFKRLTIKKLTKTSMNVTIILAHRGKKIISKGK